MEFVPTHFALKESMMKIKISNLEKKLNYKIKTNIQSIGLDIAERTGICIITTDKKNAELDWNFIEFDKSNIDNVYKEMYKEFSKIITKMKDTDNVVVIEDTFLQRFGRFVQADVFKKLTRFGTLALAVCFDKEIKYHFILAKSARAKLKIKMITGQPKESVANYLKEQFNIQLDDNDISDCYDKETEVLTNNGWKYFKSLTGDEQCFSMNLESKNASYYSIQKLIKEKYNGIMYNYKSATCNFLVTPNHKMIIRTTDVPKYIKEGKKSIIKHKKNGQFTKDSHVYWNHGKWKWHFESIKNITANAWWMPRTCNWTGIEQNKYIIPELYRDYSNVENGNKKFKRKLNKKYHWEQKQINMNDWLEFLGWYISEGNLQYNKNQTNVNSICITQTKSKEKIKEIKRLLNRLNLQYHYSKNKIFQINDCQLATHLSDICYLNKEYNCYNKKVPEFIKKLTSEQIDIFLTAFNKGDGWVEKAGNRNYRTHSKQLADDLQELIIKLGKCCSLRTEQPNNKKRWYKDHYIQTKTVGYHLKEFKYTDVYINKKDVKKIKYNDYIYCVQCEPHNTLLVRRNGQIFWSGNSIILAILGILDDLDFRSQVDIKKEKKKLKQKLDKA
jgi:hypothetical protein